MRLVFYDNPHIFGRMLNRFRIREEPEQPGSVGRDTAAKP